MNYNHTIAFSSAAHRFQIGAVHEIIYAVRVKDCPVGDLMTLKTFQELWASDAFNDSDGYGEMVRADGVALGRIVPSGCAQAHPACSYVLWFNR